MSATFFFRATMHQLLRKVVALKCRSALSTISKPYYDIVIVGGGMVGNAMAISLSLSNSLKAKKVLLIESGNIVPLVKTPIYSNRVSAVALSSVEFLKELGIWDDLVRYRIKKVDRLQVLDSCSQSEIKLQQSDYGKEVAYIIENNAIINSMFCYLQQASTVDLKMKMEIVEVCIPDSLKDLATLKLSDGTEIETSLVIGADGLNSKVRQLLKVDCTEWEYGQKGVVATLELQASSGNNVAWQRFMPTGPIALLPLSDKHSSLVWSTSNQHADMLLKLKPEEFIDELNQQLSTSKYQNPATNNLLTLVNKGISTILHLESQPAPIPPVILSLQTDTRAAFPLGFRHCHTYITRRAALIGDAAHRLHPLAGQGVNIGWNDVAILTKCLKKCANDGSDLGSLCYLSEYDRESRLYNLPMQLACDWINRLYRSSTTPVVMARSLGLYAINMLTPLRDFIVASMSSRLAQTS